MAIDLTPYPEHLKLLETKEADHLAELYLIQGDLGDAHDNLSLLIAKFPLSESLSAEDRVISASLLRNAIMLFCACFSTKDPNKLEPKAVYGHITGWEDLFRPILDTRDSYVAHNFGPQRQHTIVAICVEIGGELVPAGMTQHYARMAGYTVEKAEQFLSLINTALDHLSERIKEAEKAVLDYLEAVPSEELATLKDAGLSIPSDADIRTTRRRFRESGRGERAQLPPRRWMQTLEVESGPPRSDQQREGPDEEAPPSEPEPTG